jgi:hypothetical protein
LLEEMAATAAACACQKVCAGQFANMIVHGLARQLHAPGNARRGIGLEHGRQNLQAQRMMEKHGGLCGHPQEVEAGT